ncbi:MAG: hypothetical protein H0V82_11240 [Candidatus Protochlamydia sp.]|nr:hypothetical protein [Candidatus Protochlamydia sp.]
MIEPSAGLVVMFSLGILLAFAILFFVFWFGWWMSGREMGVSPYTGIPLRRATDLTYFAAERVLLFLFEFKQYDNRIFKLSRAAYCRETGRIFTNCVTWLDTVKVDWTFLQKRYPGSYVSWGSLNKDQQQAIRDAHDSMEGYQTESSSPTPSPRGIEPEYAYTKPGPLYVDIETKVLLGWMVVPATDLEVLIVQKPVR